MQATAEEKLRLSPQLVGDFAGVSSQLVDKWITLGYIRMATPPAGRGKPRYIDTAGFLAVLLLKLLRSKGLPTKAIAPVARFISSRTSAQLAKELDEGRTWLFAAGNRIGLAEEGGWIKADEGDTMLLAVDLLPIRAHMMFVIHRHNKSVAHLHN